MGRSQLQGTPWHYEYTKGNGTNNSKNCAFNTGDRCACKISSNHNRTCVGKSNCDEFDVKRHFKWYSDCAVSANKNLHIEVITITACGKKQHAFFLTVAEKSV